LGILECACGLKYNNRKNDYILKTINPILNPSGVPEFSQFLCGFHVVQSLVFCIVCPYFAQVLLSNTMSDRQRVIPISRYITSMIVIGNRKNTNADTWNMYLILFCNSYGILLERYVAICHPMRFQTFSKLSRSIKVIITVWIVGFCCAVPYALYGQIFYTVFDPNTHEPLEDSLVCNIPYELQNKMRYMFQVSAFVFFLLPMTIILVMYLWRCQRSNQKP
jgi:hypothetical protein